MMKISISKSLVPKIYRKALNFKTTRGDLSTMLLKILIAILLSQGCLGKSSQDGAVFTRVGTVYTGLALDIS